LNSSTTELVPWTPSSEEEKERVRRQMFRLLQTKHFKNSRRYPPLFKFLVEETIEGRGDLLKERLVGVHVFGRPADYDTATDPIVRVTIAEIRKRIAQYYHEEAHDLEMRIELTPGRYEPEFLLRRELTADDAAAVAVEVDQAPGVDGGRVGPAGVPVKLQAAVGGAPPAGRRPSRSRKARALLASGAVVLVLLAGAWGWRWMHPSAVDELWAPLLGSHQTITVCLPAGTNLQHRILPSPTFLDYQALGQNVVFSDVLATVKVSNFLAVRGRLSRVRLDDATTLDDLLQGPVVLIGGMDNQWTMRAVAPLRFHYAGSDATGYWIVDTKNPGQKDWALNLNAEYATISRDFAIVGRIHDKATGQIEVIGAGIGMTGTAAAGEFLVNPRAMEELRRRVGARFRDHDFEAVLSTEVVNGIAGAPQILAVEVW
jgi:hypothetical protein